jgi:hypothetical protein
VHAVDQGNAPVAKVEDDGVLIGRTLGADDPPGRAVEEEPAVLVPEPVHADPPRLAALGRRQVRVGHHDALGAVAAYALDAGIFVGLDAIRSPLGENLLKRVFAPVGGGEDEHVRDIVEEARPWARIPRVALAHAAREEVEDAVLDDHAGVEDRPVSGDCACFDDGPVADATHERVASAGSHPGFDVQSHGGRSRRVRIHRIFRHPPDGG